jgi:hypothetical protein
MADASQSAGDAILSWLMNEDVATRTRAVFD